MLRFPFAQADVLIPKTMSKNRKKIANLNTGLPPLQFRIILLPLFFHFLHFRCEKIKAESSLGMLTLFCFDFFLQFFYFFIRISKNKNFSFETKLITSRQKVQVHLHLVDSLFYKQSTGILSDYRRKNKTNFIAVLSSQVSSLIEFVGSILSLIPKFKRFKAPNRNRHTQAPNFVEEPYQVLLVSEQDLFPTFAFLHQNVCLYKVQKIKTWWLDFELAEFVFGHSALEYQFLCSSCLFLHLKLLLLQ